MKRAELPLEPKPEHEPSISQCIFHRCSEHLAVPQINDNEHSGAECGACIEAYYEGMLAMIVSRLGGFVETQPTNRINFLQRIDELVTKEQPENDAD